MLYKYVNYKNQNKFVLKIINIMLVLFFILSIFLVSYAESYEWTVINNINTIETNSTIVNEEGESSKNTLNTVIDELNLQCGSAILIEQTTRSNII